MCGREGEGGRNEKKMSVKEKECVGGRKEVERMEGGRVKKDFKKRSEKCRKSMKDAESSL